MVVVVVVVAHVYLHHLSALQCLNIARGNILLIICYNLTQISPVDKELPL